MPAEKADATGRNDRGNLTPIPDMSDSPVKRSRGRPLDPQRSQLIAEAAWKLLARAGYDALTFDAIAREVGCNRAAIYRRFKSKSELVSTVLRETALSLMPDVDAAKPAREALIDLVKIGVAYLSGERGSAMLNVAAVAHSSPELAHVIEAHLGAIAPFYTVQLLRLNPAAHDETVQFAIDTLLSGIVYHQGFRRVQLSDARITALVDLVIAMLEKDLPGKSMPTVA